MDFFSNFVHLGTPDADIQTAHGDVLPANSPPPLAADEVDDVDEVDDAMLDDFKVATPNDSQAFYWNASPYTKQSGDHAPKQAEKDHIAIVQELPPNLEGKRPFASESLTSDLALANSNTPLLPWDVFVQSHLQYEKHNTSYNSLKPAQIHVNTATIHPKDDFLSSVADQSLLDLNLQPDLLHSADSYFDFNMCNSLKESPSIKQEDTEPHTFSPPPASTPLEPSLGESTAPSSFSTSARSSSSSSASSLNSEETERSEEERKRRNRVYAKRSRDLKNLKYREAVDLNKDLQLRIKALQEANQKLKLRNQSLEYEVKQYRHKSLALETDPRWQASQIKSEDMR